MTRHRTAITRRLDQSGHLPYRSREAGAVAVIVALVVSTVLFGAAAFAVDLGNTLAQRVDLQGVADDAARAGAARLPDERQARAAVLANLCAVLPSQTHWSYVGCSGPSITGPTGAGIATVIAISDDEGETSGATFVATRITVTPPPVQVDFSFGGAVGINGIAVQPSSTAAIMTPSGLGILPYFLTPSDFLPADVPTLDTSVTPPAVITPLLGNFLRSPDGRFCTSIGRRNAGPACPPKAGGLNSEQGELSVPRYQVNTNLIVQNTRLGLQVAPHDWSRWRLAGSIRTADVGSNTECAAAGATESAVPSPAPFVIDVNCLKVLKAPGSNNFTERDGFFASPASRGNQVCPGGQTGTIRAGGNPVSNAADITDLFTTASLLDDSKRVAAGVPGDLLTTLTSPAPPAVGAPGWIRSAIFSCGRLALMPVLDAQLPVSNSSSGKSYPILGFAYVWIADVGLSTAASDDHGYLFSGVGRLIGLEGYLLPRWYFPELVTDSPTVIPYVGPDWPKQVVLVK